MIKSLLLSEKFIPNAFLKELTEPLCLRDNGKLFHALHVVLVTVLPPSVWRLYLVEVKLKFQYLVCYLLVTFSEPNQTLPHRRPQTSILLQCLASVPRGGYNGACLVHTHRIKATDKSIIDRSVATAY